MGKGQDPVAFLLGLDQDSILDIDTPTTATKKNRTPNRKRKLFQASSPILQELESNQTIMDFYIHYDDIFSSHSSNQDFSKAVDYVLTALDNEVQQQHNHKTPSDKAIVPTNSVTPHSPVLPKDSWTRAWEKLQASGWNCLNGDIYLPPNKTRPEGTENVDYFSSKDALQDFLRYRYDWTGDIQNSTTPTESHVAVSSHISDASPISPRDPWVKVWSKLVRDGWRFKERKGKGNNYYFPPGQSDATNGKEGVNYFTSERAVMEHVEEQFNWRGDSLTKKTRKNNDSNVPVKVVTAAESTKKSKKRKKDEESRKKKKKQTQSTSRIWGKESTKSTSAKKRKEVSLTPAKQNTKPQDPGKPLLSQCSSTTAGSSQYEWKYLWEDLKLKGWTCVRATSYNTLHNWYYMKPNCDPAKSKYKLGRDYFLDGNDVIDYLKNKKNSKVIDISSVESSPDKSNQMMDDFDQEADKEESVVESSVKDDISSSSVQNESPATAKDNVSFFTATPSTAISDSMCWWHHEGIPNFQTVWTTLQKLGFEYRSSAYCYPDLSKKFGDFNELRKSLSRDGIPNLYKADGSCNISPLEAEDLRRSISVAYLPRGIHNLSCFSFLGDIPLMSKFSAWDVMRERLEYRFEGGTYILPMGKRRRRSYGDSQESGKYFSSLEEVRQYIRGHGLIGVNESEIKADKDLLGVLLWASLSELPRHAMTRDPNTDQTPPSKPSGNEAATSSKNAKNIAKETANNVTVTQNQLGQKGDRYTRKEKDVKETSKKNEMSVSIECVDQDMDDVSSLDKSECDAEENCMEETMTENQTAELTHEDDEQAMEKSKDPAAYFLTQPNEDDNEESIQDEYPIFSDILE